MNKFITRIKCLFTDPWHYVYHAVFYTRKIWPDKLYLTIVFRCQVGYWIDWKHPKTFNEKLQWLKLYNRKPEYTTMVDKYEVKQYVADCIGEEYIIPTLGIWNKPEDIDWNSLPEQFVLKTTHGGGGGGVVICKDKNTFDREGAIAKLNRSLQSDIYYNLREWPYKNVKKRIIAEKFIVPIKQATPFSYLADYKILCFNGEPEFLCVSNPQNHKIAFFNIDWERIGIGRDDYDSFEVELERPRNLNEMLVIARKLAAGKTYVRVDLYCLADKTYFGELTFYAGNGMIPFNLKDYDGKLGDLLNLPNAICGGQLLISNGEVKKIKEGVDDLCDYKLMCFNGKVKCSFVCSERYTEGGLKVTFFDREWRILPMERKYPALKLSIAKPSQYEQMIELAEKLSQNIPFVRVDFYEVDECIYFGELTFFPGSGMEEFRPEEWDYTMGSWLNCN